MEDLKISPAVVLELEYLHEIGRLTVGGNTIVQGRSAQLGLSLCDAPFAAVVEAALSDSSLLTRDRTIRRHYRKATW